MISLLVACLAILRVNRVLLSEGLKLFYQGACCIISFLWLPKIQHAGLTHGFQVSIVACLFLIVCLFLYLPLICFRLCLHRSAFTGG